MDVSIPGFAFSFRFPRSVHLFLRTTICVGHGPDQHTSEARLNRAFLRFYKQKVGL